MENTVDCKVPVNLLATTLAQVYVGFNVGIITKLQPLIVKLLRENCKTLSCCCTTNYRTPFSRSKCYFANSRLITCN